MSPIYGVLAGLLGPLVSLIGLIVVNKNERRKINASNLAQREELEDKKKQDELERLKFEKGVRDELREENKYLKDDNNKLEERIKLIEVKLEEKSKENSEMRATLSLMLEQNADYRIQLERAISEKDFVMKENSRLTKEVAANKQEIAELKLRLDHAIIEFNSTTRKEGPVNADVKAAVVEP